MRCSIKIETKLDVPTITNQITTMDNIDITIELSKLSRKELLNKCRELNLVGYF